MTTVLFFYFFLFSFWLENVIGFKLTSMQGLSLLNVSFSFLLINWAFLSIKTKRFFHYSLINKYLFLLFFVVIFSIPIKIVLQEVPGFNLYEELVGLKGWLDPVLLFFILYNTLGNERYCRLALAGLLVFFAVTVVTTIAVAAGLFLFDKLKVIHGSRTAGFAEPNQFAGYLVLFLPFVFSGALFANALKKNFSIILLLLSLIALLTTGSRGGLISLFCATCVYIFVFSARKLVKPSGLIFSLLFVVPIFSATTFFLAPENVRTTAVERFDPSNAADAEELTSGRTTLWKNGFQLFLQSPLYGHGQATFIPLMKKNFPVWGNSHNDYLLYLVHYGLIGLVLFLMVLKTLFNESRLLARHSSESWVAILLLSYFSGLSGFAVAMFGVNMIQPLFLFWAYSAVVLRYGRLSVAP